MQHQPARSCAYQTIPIVTSLLCPRPKANLSRRRSKSAVIEKMTAGLLTRCSQHLFARKHRVGSRHETHRLLGLIKGLPSCSQADDSLGHYNSSSSNRSQKCLMFYGLNAIVIQTDLPASLDIRKNSPRCPQEVYP